MAVTVAKLMAEVGIDPRQFNAGLRQIRDGLHETAKETVAFSKEIDAATKQTNASFRQLSSSREKLLRTNEAFKVAENNLAEALTKSQRATQLVTSLENKLQAARRDGSPKAAQYEIALARAKDLVATAERRLENATVRRDQAARAAVNSAMELKRTEDALSAAQTKAAEATKKFSESQAQLAADALKAAAALSQAQAEAAQEAIAQATAAKKIDDAVNKQTIAFTALRQVMTGMVTASTEFRLQQEREAEALEEKNKALRTYQTEIGATTTKLRVLQNFNLPMFQAFGGLAQNQDLTARMNAWASGADKVATKMKHLGTTATFGLSVPVALLGKNLFDSAVQLEKYVGSLGVAMKDAEKAKERFNELVEVSRLPGLNLQSLVRGDVALQGVKFSPEESLETLKQWGNELALFNGSAEEYQRVVINLQQISGAKTLAGDELREMAELIPSLRQALRDLYNTDDTKELKELGITGAQVIRDLTVKFSESARAADSAQNDIKNFNNELFIMAAQGGKELIPFFRDFTKIAIPTLKTVTDAFTGLPPEVKKTAIQIGILTAAFGPLTYSLSNFVSLAGFTVKGLAAVVTWAGTARFAMAAVAAGAATTGEAMVLMFGPALAAAAPYIAVLAAIAAGAYAIKLAWDAANDTGQKSVEQINAEYKAYQQNLASKQKNLTATSSLIAEYDKLASKQNRSNAENERMRKLYDDIASKSPGLTLGYDKLGNAIGLVADHMERLAKETAKANEQMRISKVVGDYSDQLTALNDRLFAAQERVKTLQTYGLRVDKDMTNKGNFRGPVPNSATFEMITSGDKFTQALGAAKKEVDDTTAAIAQMKKAISGAFDGNKSPFKSTSQAGAGGDTKGAEEVIRLWKREAKEVAKAFNLRVSSEYRPGAKVRATGQPSEHGAVLGKQKGLALDFAGSAQDMADFFDYVRKTYGDNIKQMLYSPKGKVIGGRYSAEISDPRTKADHYDHVHLSLKSGLGNTNDLQDVIFGRKEAAKALRDQMREAKKEENEYQRIVDALTEKNNELTVATKGSTNLTKAQALAAEYAADNMKNFGGSLDFAKLAQFAQVTAIQQANVELQKQLDLQELLGGAREKIQEQWQQMFLNSLPERKREMVQAFGVKDWKNPAIPDKVKKTFADLFYSNKDRETLREAIAGLKDYRENLKETLDTLMGRKGKTNLEKANEFIEKQIEKIGEAARKSNIPVSQLIEQIRRVAAETDKQQGFKEFNAVNAPMLQSIEGLKNWMNGDVDKRANAWQEFVRANKEFYTGLDFAGQREVKNNFFENFDLQKSAELIQDIKREMFGLEQQARILGENDPYERWVMSLEFYDAELNKVRLPDWATPDRTRGIFNQREANSAKEKMNEMYEASVRAAAELTAKNPFEQWLISMSEVDRESGKLRLANGLDEEFLRKTFEFQKNIALIKEFADGVRNIFSDMAYDIAENGFKGLFANIYMGFKQLLFKMAVEYLSSKLYGLLINSLVNVFKVSAPKAGGGIDNGPGIGSPETAGMALVSSAGAGATVTTASNALTQFRSQSSEAVSSIGGAKSYMAYNSYGDANDYSTVNSSGGSNSSQTTINQSFTYNIYTNDEKKIRQTVTQSVMDAQKMADRKKKRLG